MTTSARTLAIIGAVYVGATILMTWPLLGHFGSALPHDLGDPAFVSWVYWWNAHATPLTERWWNAPIFVPLKGAFAFSESILSVAPITTPLQWLGATPVVAYNVVFVLSFFLSAVGAHALAFRLTRRHDASLLAGLAFGFSPYRVPQIPHEQLLITWWMPLGLYALHQFLETRRTRYLIGFGVCWCLNGLTSGYFLVFFAVIVLLWIAWFARSRRDLLALVTTLVVASLPVAPVVIGYQQRQAAFGFERGLKEIQSLSAQLQSFWSASIDTVARHWTFRTPAEGQLYPGLIVALLAVTGIVLGVRAQARPPRSRGRRALVGVACAALAIGLAEAATGGWQPSIGGATISLTHPYKIISVATWFFAIALVWDRRWRDAWRRRSTFAFYAIAAAVTAVLALGPTGLVFDARFLLFAPYTWLMSMPGGHALRVPARFGHVAILCLVQVAAMAFVRIFPRGLPRAAFTACALAVFVEGWMPMLPLAPLPASFDVAAIDPGAPLLVLPRHSLLDDTADMLRSTADGHPLLNGYSGYSPPHDDVARYALEHDDGTVLPALQSTGPFLIVVDRTRDTDDRARALVEDTAGITLVRTSGTTLVYRAAARPRTALLDDPRVSIAAVTFHGARLDAVRDGDPGTLWENTAAQAPGQSVEVELGRAAAVTRVEIDLGRAPMEYPRQLRVTSETGQVLWEGRTAGLTVIGALSDPIRVPITLNLATPVITSRLTLTLTAAGYDDDLPWGIAEVRVFGK